jgi:hypothetical protein
VHLFQVGHATLSERPKEVQRERGLVVRLDETLRVRHARGSIKADAVDVVTPIDGKGDAALCLEVRRTWFGELPGHPPDLDDRHRRTVGEHHRHLQDELERVSDRVDVKLSKGLGAIAALKKERFTLCYRCKLLPEASCLTGEDERR